MARKTMFRGKTKGENRIPLADISSIPVQPESGLQSGWLQVAVLGATAAISEQAKAMTDPNTVLFDKRHQDRLTQFARWLNQVVEQNRAAGRSVATDRSTTGGPGASGEILFTGISQGGRNATVTLYRDCIERVKSRAFSSLRSAHQDVEVTPIRAVASVQAKKDSFINTKVTVYASGSNIDFLLHMMRRGDFNDMITELILSHDSAPATPVVIAAPPAPAEPDVLDQLRRLGELRDAGVLTSDKFETKKSILLKRL